jgi:hypothetical protein
VKLDWRNLSRGYQNCEYVSGLHLCSKCIIICDITYFKYWMTIRNLLQLRNIHVLALWLTGLLDKCGIPTHTRFMHPHSLGWQPVAFFKAANLITIHADSCNGESIQDHMACKSCAALSSSGKFQYFVNQAFGISEFANWEYLNAKQLQAAMRRLSNKC